MLQAVFSRPIAGTACVLFEGEHFAKLSIKVYRGSQMSNVSKILSKFDIKHRIAAKGLFPCLLERLVFGE